MSVYVDFGQSFTKVMQSIRVHVPENAEAYDGSSAPVMCRLVSTSRV